MIHFVRSTRSTNDDVKGLAAAGHSEGTWLRAEAQSEGRGRQGRGWSSPAGNLYASTLVRLRAGDPPAPTLALVAAVALEEVVRAYLSFSPPPALRREGQAERSDARERGNREPLSDSPSPSPPAAAFPRPAMRAEGLMIKWPNDLLLDRAKLSGILLEREGDAVVIGFGVNLASAPELPDRPATSLAAAGIAPDPAGFLDDLAEALARWLAIWRGQGLAPVRARWLERAHPPGTALAARTADGGVIEGLFAGLDEAGALLLSTAEGTRTVQAGDVFVIG